MFKRFTCMILSLVLLMALLPAGVIEASAASHTTSDSAITILKKLETFEDNCNVDGYIGYGTKCTESGRHGIVNVHKDPVTGKATNCNSAGYLANGTKCPVTDTFTNGHHGPVHTIRENEASADLKKAMQTIDASINDFASKNGLSLTQSQHDALAIFSFENGTGWTKGTDEVQNAVVRGTTGQEFVNIMKRWQSGTADDERRMIEANMYLFGVYNTSSASLATNLKNESSSDSSDDLVTDDRVKVTVTNDFINVRQDASIYSTKVGTVYRGEVLRITTTKSANGYLWGKYVDSSYKKVGYVALMYTNYDQLIAADKIAEEEAANKVSSVMGTATVDVNGYVNVRSGAGTKNPIVSSLRDETKVDLYEIQYVNGQRWGRINVGWFSLAYAKDVKITNSDKVITNDLGYLSYQFKDTNGKDFTANSTPTDIQTVKFTTLTEVTVRKTAEIDGERDNILAKGTEFDVTKVVSDKNTIWGYTVDAKGKYQGWIDLSTKYVSRNGVTVEAEKDDSSETCKLATVVNCVEVNMRDMANIWGTKVGTLAAGTTVEVKEGPVNGTKKTGWYRLKVTNGHGTESWVRGDYLDVHTGTKAEINYGKTPTSPDGSKAATGQGMVANTYGGVNVRTAPGTANAKVTKLLPGTTVDILEVTFHGTTKWGRIEQGWVCMDYIAMMDYDDAPGSSSDVVVATAAVYEGAAAADGVVVYAKPDRTSDVVRTLSQGDELTIHELLTATEVISESDDKKTTLTRYWARVNDGYICDNLMLERNSLGSVLSVNTLYEETYTVTETDLLKVREDAGTSNAREDLDLKKGDQVAITKVKIVGSQFWGQFEHDSCTDGKGWICLNYCTKGAVTVGGNESTEGGNGGAVNDNPAAQPMPLSTGNTGKGNYMGTIIGNYPEVNVRKDPDANAEKVTELKKGASVTITETRLVDGRSWGYCGTGWINLVYVDLTPVGITAIDAKVIATNNTLCYASSETDAEVVGSYASRAVVNIYEEVNGMYKTDMGWISKANCL